MAGFDSVAVSRFYHRIDFRDENGVVRERVYGSEADNIDDAWKERLEIIKEYGASLVAHSTHDIPKRSI